MFKKSSLKTLNKIYTDFLVDSNSFKRILFDLFLFIHCYEQVLLLLSKKTSLLNAITNVLLRKINFLCSIHAFQNNDQLIYYNCYWHRFIHIQKHKKYYINNFLKKKLFIKINKKSIYNFSSFTNRFLLKFKILNVNTFTSILFFSFYNFLRKSFSKVFYIFLNSIYNFYLINNKFSFISYKRKFITNNINSFICSINDYCFQLREEKHSASLFNIFNCYSIFDPIEFYSNRWERHFFVFSGESFYEYLLKRFYTKKDLFFVFNLLNILVLWYVSSIFFSELKLLWWGRYKNYMEDVYKYHKNPYIVLEECPWIDFPLHGQHQMSKDLLKY
jgi:hypothetical protein